MLLAGAVVLAIFVLPSIWGALAIVAGMVVEVLEVVFWIRFLRRYRVQTGAEGLVGALAEVVEPCEPLGRVRLRGELWNARSPRRVGVGERVRVTAVDGLTLEVLPDD